MAPKTVGIELGSTAVRVVVCRPADSEGFATIERFGSAPVRREAVIAGRIRNKEAAATALFQALKAAGVSGSRGISRRAVVGVTTPEPALGRFQVPTSVRPGERVSTLRANSVQVGHLPLSEVALSTHQIETTTDTAGNKVTNLNVAAVPEADLTAALDVCHLAGITPMAVDLAASGVFRALVRDVPTSDVVTSIVDIGATQTVVLSREGVNLRSVRSLAAGGDDLTRAIAAVLKEDLDAAELRKHRLRLTSAATSGPVSIDSGYGSEAIVEADYGDEVASATAVENALVVAADSLVDQIAQAIELDVQQYRTAPAQVALCGGTSLLRGLKDRLQRRLNLEVIIGHPWAKLANNKANKPFFTAEGREDPRVLLSLAGATGLALWSLPS